MQAILRIIFIILCLFILIMFIYFVSGVLGLIFSRVPYVPTFDSEIDTMKNGLNLESGKKIIDLGVGNAKALRFLVKTYGLSQGVGYDINLFAVIWGRLLNWFYRFNNIKLIFSKFQNANLVDFDYVYVYLLPEYLAKIEDWVFEKINLNCVVVSNSFKFAKREPFQVIKNKKGKDIIFLYKK